MVLISDILNLMRSTGWVSVGLWLAFAPAGAPASSSHRVTFIQLAPPSEWRIVATQTLNLSQLSGWGVIPAVESEYGVKDAILQTYAGSGTRIQVLVEEASDPSAAFGLLTFYQTEGMRGVPGMALTVSGRGLALMARNAAFFRVLMHAPLNDSESRLRAFLISLGGARPSAHSMDLMPASLPSKGIIPGSEKYALGPEVARRAIPWVPPVLLGFAEGAEAHTATYERSGGTVSLLLVSYPTPQIARLRFKAMQEQLHLSQDRQQGQMFGRQDGSFVFLVDRLGTATPSEAVALLNDLTVNKVVTQDERYPGKPIEVQLLELIIANILLILVLLGTSVVGGVMMVISRHLLTKWFPNSEWGLAGEGNLIQLHLQGR